MIKRGVFSFLCTVCVIQWFPNAGGYACWPAEELWTATTQLLIDNCSCDCFWLKLNGNMRDTQQTTVHSVHRWKLTACGHCVSRRLCPSRLLRFIYIYGPHSYRFCWINWYCHRTFVWPCGGKQWEPESACRYHFGCSYKQPQHNTW